MKIIALTIQKGGVSKTTTTAALASGLVSAGKRVLLVDLDPQQNLSFSEGINVLNIPFTLYDVWKGSATIEDAIQQISLQLHIITGGLQLTSADFEFASVVGREQLLKHNLEKVFDRYDYCLIDCPPSLGLLTMTAATAADYIIIPMTVDALAIQGLSQLWGFIRNIKTYCNAHLSIAGILLTQYDPRATTTKGLEDQIITFSQRIGSRVFDTRIHKSQAIRTAQAMGSTDVFLKSAKAAVDYRNFSNELLNIVEGGK